MANHCETCAEAGKMDETICAECGYEPPEYRVVSSKEYAEMTDDVEGFLLAACIQALVRLKVKYDIKTISITTAQDIYLDYIVDMRETFMDFAEAAGMNVKPDGRSW